MIDSLWVAVISVTISAIILVISLYYARKLGFFKWIKVRKKPIIIVLVWSVAVALVIIKSYWFIYLKYPVLVEQGIAWTGIEQWIPRLDIYDLLLIFLFSIIAGAMILDIETTIYGFIATTILSFVIAGTYSFLFIWFILEFNNILPYLGWTTIERATTAAILNISRMTIPFVAILCLMGVMLGAFARGYFQPSSESQKARD